MGSIFISLLPAQPPAWMDATVLAIVAVNEFTWFALLALLFSGGAARAFYRRDQALARPPHGRRARPARRAVAGKRGLVAGVFRRGGDAALDFGQAGRSLGQHELRLGAAEKRNGSPASRSCISMNIVPAGRQFQLALRSWRRTPG